MRQSRKLTIRREAMTELAVPDLRAVGAAREAPSTFPLRDCMSDRFGCDSVLRPCVSHTCTL